MVLCSFSRSRPPLRSRSVRKSPPYRAARSRIGLRRPGVSAAPSPLCQTYQPMRAVVIYESLTGNTARAAQLIADAAQAAGAEVTVFPIDRIGLKDLAEADVVF